MHFRHVNYLQSFASFPGAFWKETPIAFKYTVVSPPLKKSSFSKHKDFWQHLPTSVREVESNSRNFQTTIQLEVMAGTFSKIMDKNFY